MKVGTEGTQAAERESAKGSSSWRDERERTSQYCRVVASESKDTENDLFMIRCV